jgi:hypothetical protein
MWDDVVIANEAAVQVRNAMLAVQGQEPKSYGHYNFWLIYGYLEQGRYQKARELLEAAYAQAEEFGKSPEDPMILDPDRSIVGSVVQMWLRYLIETGDWDGEIADWRFRMGDAFDPNLNYTFAQAVRQARASMPSKAQEQLAQFQRLKESLSAEIAKQEEQAPGDLMYLERLDIMEQEMLAMIEAAKGEFEPAVTFALESSRLEGELPRAFGPPYIDLPTAQLLGDLYLAAGNNENAEAAYQLELERNRQRTAALRGLIAANEALGNAAEANYYRNKLALIWHLADTGVDGMPD